MSAVDYTEYIIKSFNPSLEIRQGEVAEDTNITFNGFNPSLEIPFS